MIIQQTFEYSDLSIVALLILLEGLLSADNMFILAVMVQSLQQDLRRKALLYGIVGAVILRLLAIIFAGKIISLWWLQAIGALYLLTIPIRHFIKVYKKRKSSLTPSAKPVQASFWKTVMFIELTDMSFSIDSVLAGVAMVGRADKMWIVYLGAVIGILILRFSSGIFSSLLERYPSLDHLAYIIVGWVAIKLSLIAGHNFTTYYKYSHIVVPEMSHDFFWAGMSIIIITGIIQARRSNKSYKNLIKN